MNTGPTVVSLVPSLTETLALWGLGERLVGRTRYCSEPARIVEAVETVGGTKNPDLERIISLAPDLVVVNKEENRRVDCERLREHGLKLHVTHPRTVDDAAAMLASLGQHVGAQADGLRLADDIRTAVATLVGSSSKSVRSRQRVFCPIWRRPWMSFNNNTFIGSMLATVGGDNIFGARDGEFFEVDVEEVFEAKPDIVLLPDEPYAFTSTHGDELIACFAERGLRPRVLLCDGKDLSWYGPRIPGALKRLAASILPA